MGLAAESQSNLRLDSTAVGMRGGDRVPGTCCSFVSSSSWWVFWVELYTWKLPLSWKASTSLASTYGSWASEESGPQNHGGVRHAFMLALSDVRIISSLDCSWLRSVARVWDLYLQTISNIASPPLHFWAPPNAQYLSIYLVPFPDYRSRLVWLKCSTFDSFWPKKIAEITLISNQLGPKGISSTPFFETQSKYDWECMIFGRPIDK